MPRRPSGARALGLAAAVLLSASLTACAPAHARGATGSTPDAGRPTASSGGGAAAPGSGSRPGSTSGATQKVMVLVEENETRDDVLSSGRARYLAGLARQFGTASAMDAGYPVGCPSLAAYIILTSGYGTHICDDGPPSAHPRKGTSVFAQVAASGRQWRAYAESMPSRCATADAPRFLVRHTPAAYYPDIAADCARWDVPLGSPSAGALHDDLARGTLPAYAFVTPDACHDMHGAPGCAGDLVRAGDDWLRAWMPLVLASPDFTSGRLAVIVTFDEGNSRSNGIATVVLSARTRHVVAPQPFTHCSTLRTVQDVLGLEATGCAVGAPSMRRAFGL